MNEDNPYEPPKPPTIFEKFDYNVFYDIILFDNIIQALFLGESYFNKIRIINVLFTIILCLMLNSGLTFAVLYLYLKFFDLIIAHQIWKMKGEAEKDS